jgi:hypothetical protein
MIVSRLWAFGGHPIGTPGSAQGDIFRVPPYFACDVEVSVAGVVTSSVLGAVVAGCVVAFSPHAARGSTKQQQQTSANNTFILINASS